MRIKTSPLARAIVGYMLVLVLVVATMGSVALAQGYGYGYGYRHHQYQGYGSGVQISAAQANSIALSRFPGRLVGTTRLIRVGNRLAYQVHVRQGDLRRVVDIDARTGRVDRVRTTTIERRAYRY